MKRLVLIILLFLAVIIQTAVFPNVSVWGIFPELFLVIVVSFCLLENYLEACIWSVAGGFMLDLFSAKSFGLSAISLIATVLVIYLISFSLEFGKVYSKILLAGIASLTYYITLIIFSVLFDLMKLSDNLLHINWRIILIVAASTAINSILIIVIFPLIGYFNEWLIRVEKKLETRLL